MCLASHPSLPKVAPIPPPPPAPDVNAQLAPSLNINHAANQSGSLPAFRNDLTIPFGGAGSRLTDLNIPT